MAAGDDNKGGANAGTSEGVGNTAPTKAQVTTAVDASKPTKEDLARAAEVTAGFIHPVGTVISGDQQEGESWQDYLQRQNRQAIIQRSS